MCPVGVTARHDANSVGCLAACRADMPNVTCVTETVPHVPQWWHRSWSRIRELRYTHTRTHARANTTPHRRMHEARSPVPCRAVPHRCSNDARHRTCVSGLQVHGQAGRLDGRVRPRIPVGTARLGSGWGRVGWGVNSIAKSESAVQQRLLSRRETSAPLDPPKHMRARTHTYTHTHTHTRSLSLAPCVLPVGLSGVLTAHATMPSLADTTTTSSSTTPSWTRLAWR